MKLNGVETAEKIREEIKTNIKQTSSWGRVPKIAIITLGDESSWENYVSQKLKVAQELGIAAELINLKEANETQLLETINRIDNDSTYHGIIVQRPMPTNINKQSVINAISARKDIDGFRPDSPFEVPVWLAVRKLIGQAMDDLKIEKTWQDLSYTVLGKGETAGTPIINGLKSMGIEPIVIDSKTQNPQEIIKNADVVISCVGIANVIKPEFLKNGVILIGVGTHTEDGKIRGDYHAKDIESIASAYTTTPGGVGPVNLSFLFKNLLEAAAKQ